VVNFYNFYSVSAEYFGYHLLYQRSNYVVQVIPISAQIDKIKSFSCNNKPSHRHNGFNFYYIKATVDPSFKIFPGRFLKITYSD
jgi:hypothetical protein